MRAAGVVLTLVLIAAPAAAQKVTVDYNPTADIASYKTFAWSSTPEFSIRDNNPLNHSRVKNAMEYYLAKAGMVEVDENPDIYVTYYGESDSDFNLDIASTGGYVYPTDWQWDPYWGNASGTMTTTQVEVRRGMLVIDIWDAEDQEIIWRATMSGVLTDNLQKSAKQLDKGIQKIVKKWRKMREADKGKF